MKAFGLLPGFTWGTKMGEGGVNGQMLPGIWRTQQPPTGTFCQTTPAPVWAVKGLHIPGVTEGGGPLSLAFAVAFGFGFGFAFAFTFALAFGLAFAFTFAFALTFALGLVFAFAFFFAFPFAMLAPLEFCRVGPSRRLMTGIYGCDDFINCWKPGALARLSNSCWLRILSVV
jgi:hypothetical protein